MDPRRASLPHLRPRDVSSFSSPHLLEREASWSVGHAVFGQHHSDCLHQEPGWDSLASTLPALYRPATVVRCGKDHASCQPHSRTTERACGRPVSLPSNRMGAESRGFPGVAPSFSAHGDRPVCHEIQRKASLTLCHPSRIHWRYLWTAYRTSGFTGTSMPFHRSH